jgi:hypothetical protein
MLDYSQILKDFEEHLRKHPEHEYRGMSTDLLKAKAIIGRIEKQKDPYEDYQDNIHI